MPSPSEENILHIEPPVDDQVGRIKLLAKALAYGVINGYWSPEFNVKRFEDGRQRLASTGPKNYQRSLNLYLEKTWEQSYPEMSFLEIFEYARVSGGHCILTPKAFTLLEAPVTPPSVFISYKRDESSAFGLLLVSRLQAKGVQNPFIDMDISPGDKWHAGLREKIYNSSYFVCLIGSGTLSSPWVCKEIKWALEAERTEDITLISIWHNGFVFKDDGSYEPEIVEFVNNRHAICGQPESAEGYNNAVVKLLSKMGYAP